MHERNLGGNTRRSRVLSLLFGAWHAYKPLICLSCDYLPGRCVFVGNLIRNFTLYLRVWKCNEKITRVWLAENESIFHVIRVQSCGTNAILLSLKNLLVLTNTKLHSKSCCYLYLKYTRKIYALLIGWNRVHLSCNTGAKLEHEYKLQIAGTLSKFRLPCLWEMPFSCILFLGNIVISRAISCKGTLEKRSPYLVRAVRPISLEKQISFISCVLQDSYVLIWKPQSAWSDLFFFPNFIGSQSLLERTTVKTIFKILVWRNF